MPSGPKKRKAAKKKKEVQEIPKNATTDNQDEISPFEQQEAEGGIVLSVEENRVNSEIKINNYSENPILDDLDPNGESLSASLVLDESKEILEAVSEESIENLLPINNVGECFKKISVMIQSLEKISVMIQSLEKTLNEELKSRDEFIASLQKVLADKFTLDDIN